MPKELAHRGETSKPISVFIQDTTSIVGGGLTGLAYNTAGLTAYYRRTGDATWTAISLVTATLGTWTSGGFVEEDATHSPGIYELGLPNACLNLAGSNSVRIVLKGAANMYCAPVEIQLVDFDPKDAVRLGLTALPNANAGATGGSPTVDGSNGVKLSVGTGTGQLNLSGGIAPADVVKLNSVAASAANLERSASTIYRGTITGASPTTTALVDSSLTQADDTFWKGRVIIFTSGTLADQATDITGFTAASHTLAYTALTSAPATSDTYVIV